MNIPAATTASNLVSAPSSNPTSASEGTFRSVFKRSEEHTSELQSRLHLVCRLLLEKKKHRGGLHPRLHLVWRILVERKYLYKRGIFVAHQITAWTHRPLHSCTVSALTIDSNAISLH